jgi:uncharacterized membrane protein
LVNLNKITGGLIMFKDFFKKIKKALLYFEVWLIVTIPMTAFAASDATAAQNPDAVNLENQLKQAVSSVAIPIGIALIFIGLVLSAIKIIVSHSNPSKRSQALEGVGWLIGGSIALGLITTIFGLVLSISKLS